ncbi:MAG TPA: 2'-5' RNA ligase family protein [Rhizomicrobium sp.]|nr:2'-5' RNA ligase family protein [Rhizomicrobium sp.]
MSDQLSLPGLAAAPTDRLFFALMPEAPAAAQAGELVENLRGSCRLTGRALPSRRLHVTLHHVGDFAGLPEAVVGRAKEAGDGLKQQGFAIRFDRAGSFLRKQRTLPLVLRGGAGVTPLIAFQDALGKALATRGFRPSSHYTPHMTLLYDSRYVEARDVSPVEWSAKDYVLIRSFIGKSRYEMLGRWALAG